MDPTRNTPTEQAGPLDEQDRDLLTRWVSRAAAGTPVRAEVVRWLLRMDEPIATCHLVAGFVSGYRA